ncbi:uncharacterized protein LOC130590838 [Beta vulgaris subsp. vulgaris]|uniref:uncharacterized protein LOC130590838 n=1 Tax=Beta vulgaris subsp. vulgaris TaxID=3555 RepID=UPI002546D60D|nr:uncharacterized protein LOC130590838 [Beta vulgaris subsp. vulgaris]
MVTRDRVERLKDSIHCSNAFGVSSQGRSGGLCVFWREEKISFNLVSFSQHHICGDVVTNNGVEWRFVGLYGWAEGSMKHQTWTLIRHLCEETGLPIIFGGDFNEILSYDEKEGGANTERREITHFREVMDSCRLRDLGYEGQWWTWERGRSSNTRVRERLDRFVATSDWLELFPQATVTHLLRYKSDHCPIVVRLSPRRKHQGAGRRGFKFETAWLLEEGCERTVKEAWEQGAGKNVVARIEEVAGGLLRRSGKSLNNLAKQVEQTEKALKVAQQRRITQDSCMECNNLETKLDDLISKQEAYWYLRSRVSEVRDGDRNTNYFHHKASQRRSRNKMKGLYDEEGVWQEDEDKLEEIVVSYYSKLFSSTEPRVPDTQRVLQHMGRCVSHEMNMELTKPYTKVEIFEALQQMHPCKAPGPDGIHALFFQKFWHIVGDELSEFVIDILHGSVIPEYVNNTNIVMIPKIKDPTEVAHYRPISLCNVVYKLVSKAMVIRLKNILPELVSENQSAFVPGRQITDNALIAMELFHSMKYRNKCRRGVIAMKLDMSKAYDRVEWGFLQKLLLTMGFDGRWVNLIMNCVSSVNYSFVINGRVKGAVRPSRGLRQGNPLSPYLFILVADAFSRMLLSAVQEKRIHGARASRGGQEISHLLFADDSLLFARANRQECLEIVDLLNKYEAASGQKINYDKSEVSFSKGVSTTQKEELMNLLKMRRVDRHEKYLGIPTVAGRSKKAVFGALLDRIWKKLQGWKEKLLSRAGKEVLLKSVIQAMPTYLMGVYKFPSWVTNAISTAMARFFWGQTEGRRRVHWRSWKSMCELKCLGGLGFKDLEVFNDALLGRQAWRIMKGDNTLLGKVMKAKYYHQSTFLEASLGYSPSFAWKGIWGAKALVKEGMIWRVGNGEMINVWRDPWIADEDGRFISSPMVDNVRQVKDLMMAGSSTWNIDLITRVFNERDTKCILALPLSEQSKEDVITWAFTKDGVYSVKTAYMLGKMFNLDGFHEAWVKLWKVEVSPKVRLFLWRLCTGTLPTRALLHYRHMLEHNCCSWCGEEETVSHALFLCPRVTDLWSESGCEQLIDGVAQKSMQEVVASWATSAEKLHRRAMLLAWHIWMERNAKVFNNAHTANPILLARVQRAIEEHDKYAKRIYGLQSRGGVESAKIWKAPLRGVVKLNCDASLACEGWVGLGVVARDSDGKVLFAASRRVRAHWPVEIAEGKAILMAVRLARRFGYANVVLESDSKVLIARLSKAMVYFSDLDAVLDDILMSSSCFNSLSWSHVKRDGNAVAHHLAKIVPFGIEQVWENHSPMEVEPYVFMDFLSKDE